MYINDFSQHPIHCKRDRDGQKICACPCSHPLCPLSVCMCPLCLDYALLCVRKKVKSREKCDAGLEKLVFSLSLYIVGQQPERSEKTKSREKWEDKSYGSLLSVHFFLLGRQTVSNEKKDNEWTKTPATQAVKILGFFCCEERFFLFFKLKFGEEWKQPQKRGDTKKTQSSVRSPLVRFGSKFEVKNSTR